MHTAAVPAARLGPLADRERWSTAAFGSPIGCGAPASFAPSSAVALPSSRFAAWRAHWILRVAARRPGSGVPLPPGVGTPRRSCYGLRRVLPMWRGPPQDPDLSATHFLAQ